MRSFVLAFIALLILGACASTQTGSGQSDTVIDDREGAPLPLDPLTRGEAARAQEIARSDDRTRELLGGEVRLVYALSIAPKLSAQQDEPRGRYADLLYIRADNEHGVRVLVDLAANQVVSQSRVAAQSVPLGRADVAEALRIAQESGELRELAGINAADFRVLPGPITRELANSNYVEGLRHIGSGPNDPCTRNRCVYLLFNSGGRMLLTDQEVLVDLNERRVRVNRVEHRERGH